MIFWIIGQEDYMTGGLKAFFFLSFLCWKDRGGKFNFE